jgi:hypothetical protein
VSIGFPVWWQGGYPDIEKLMRALFQPLLTNVEVVSWLPKPDVYETQLSAGKGYLRCYRTGGKINRDQNRDEPKVQLAALTRHRDDSWELIEFARQVGEAFIRGALVPGTPTQLECSGEVVGPQLIPELIADDRLVPITLEFYTWRPRDFKYRQALGL